MVSKSEAQEIKWFLINTTSAFKLFLEVGFLENKKKGEFTIGERKKKREIIEENKRQINLPSDVSDEEKKALEQTGEDATSGW
jgi:hypothetical protein